MAQTLMPPAIISAQEVADFNYYQGVDMNDKKAGRKSTSKTSRIEPLICFTSPLLLCKMPKMTFPKLKGCSL